LQILLQKQQREPPPPSQLAPGVPEDLDRLCTELLRFDIAARPSGAHVLRRLGGSTDTGRHPRASFASSHAQGAQFVGRDAELAAIRQAYADARSHGGVAVLVRGESGVGKSWLVRQFTETCALEEPS